MPSKKKLLKKKLLEAQTKEGERQLIAITADARRRIEERIVKAVERGNFVQAAVIRDGLYREVAKEYVRLNKNVDDWTKKRAEKISRAWHVLAIDDLPEAAGAFTFGQFSKKYLNDIIGAINPSTIGNKVAINPRIQGMISADIRAIRIAVSETVREGALTGMNNHQLTKEMISKATAIKPTVKFVDAAGRTWNSESYFGMLNRTLHATVARETYADTAVEIGYDLFTIDGGSSTSCLPCSQWAGKKVSMTGKTKGYPTAADATAAGVFHPNCCVPETLVECPDLQAASRFIYSGEMVKIKYASGNTLTVTPNHMLLTDQGFTTADTLAKGDYVICTSKRNGLGLGSPDIDGEPSTIEDVFMTLRQSCGVSSAQMPVSPEHFHGDGKFGNGYIDIIAPNRLLLYNFCQQIRSEPIGQLGFVTCNSELPFFTGDSSLASLLLCAGCATNRIVSGLSVSGAPFCSSSSLCDAKLFSLAPDIYSCGNKSASDEGRTTAKQLSDFIVSNSGLIELDSVVSVDVIFYSGHVYDLQSVSTLYTANGCLSSNCIHTFGVYIP